MFYLFTKVMNSINQPNLQNTQFACMYLWNIKFPVVLQLEVFRHILLTLTWERTAPIYPNLRVNWLILFCKWNGRAYTVYVTDMIHRRENLEHLYSIYAWSRTLYSTFIELSTVQHVKYLSAIWQTFRKSCKEQKDMEATACKLNPTQDCLDTTNMNQKRLWEV